MPNKLAPFLIYTDIPSNFKLCYIVCNFRVRIRVGFKIRGSVTDRVMVGMVFKVRI